MKIKRARKRKGQTRKNNIKNNKTPADQPAATCRITTTTKCISLMAPLRCAIQLFVTLVKNTRKPNRIACDAAFCGLTE